MRKLVLVISLLAMACGKLAETPTGPGGNGDPVDETATLTRVQSEVFTPTCTVIGCHDPLGQQQQLVLANGRSYASLVGKPSTQMPSLLRVQAGDPANSYLYRKITGFGITGDRMPQSSPPLSDAQIKLVRDWIRRGAPND